MHLFLLKRRGCVINQLDTAVLMKDFEWVRDFWPPHITWCARLKVNLFFHYLVCFGSIVHFYIQKISNLVLCQLLSSCGKEQLHLNDWSSILQLPRQLNGPKSYILHGGGPRILRKRVQSKMEVINSISCIGHDKRDLVAYLFIFYFLLPFLFIP